MKQLHSFASVIDIVEVGPRDGLQNESAPISLDDKFALIENLLAAGLERIEAGSFVNPKWVPQMADSDALFARLQNLKTRYPKAVFSALTPNARGAERAIAAGADELAIFAAASEAFSQKNLNCSIEQSLARFDDVLDLAQKHNLPVRGYISCVAGCPYQGDVDIDTVAQLSEQLIDMGCFEVSLGDTTGVATALHTAHIVAACAERTGIERLAVHMHDTYGQALANIFAALQQGIRVIDSSVAGLGGCPYAKGASGNVASEDVIYMLNGMGLNHGVELSRLMHAGNTISRAINRPSGAKSAMALSMQS